MYKTPYRGELATRRWIIGTALVSVLACTAGCEDSPTAPSGPGFTVTVSTCEGEYTFGNTAGLADVEIAGTVHAHRDLTTVEVTAFANGERVGTDFLGFMSENETERFHVTGSVILSGSTVECRAEVTARG